MSKVAFVAGSRGGIGKAVMEHLMMIGFNASWSLDIKVDLSMWSQVKSIAEEHKENLTCVVNCVGKFAYTNAGFDMEIFKNNLVVADNILSVFTPIMSDTPGARIITIGSIDSKYPNVNSYAYCAAKAGVKTLVDCYRKAHKDSKVNFDLILPGGTNTKMRSGKSEDKTRLLQPDDIAHICVMLMESSPNVSFEDIIVYPKSFTYVP